MKRFLVLLSCCFSFFQHAKAQDYLPLVQENATWVVSFDDVEGTPWLDTWHSYKITTDTVVNGLTYKKVIYRDLAHDWMVHEVIYPYQYYNEQLYGLIREDLGERKVYYLKLNDEQHRPSDCPTGEEIILYDFSSEIGAEQSFCHFFNEPPSSLTNIDTTYTDWGIFPAYYWGEGYIIEQIGSHYGLLETPIPNVSGYWESLYDYCVGTDEECAFFTSANEAIAPANMPLISPNPFDKTLTINNLSDWKEMTIVDALGRKIAQQKINHTDLELDGTLFLTTGIYYLRVANETQTTTIKVVKK